MPNTNEMKRLWRQVQQAYEDYQQMNATLEKVTAKLSALNKNDLKKMATQCHIAPLEEDPDFQALTQCLQDFYFAIHDLNEHLTEQLQAPLNKDKRPIQAILAETIKRPPTDPQKENLNTLILTIQALMHLLDFSQPQTIEHFTKAIDALSALKTYVVMTEAPASLMGKITSKILPNLQKAKEGVIQELTQSAQKVIELPQKHQTILSTISTTLETLVDKKIALEISNALKNHVTNQKQALQGKLPNWESINTTDAILGEALSTPFKIDTHGKKMLSLLESNVRKPAKAKVLHDINTAQTLPNLEKHLTTFDKVKTLYQRNEEIYTHYEADTLKVFTAFYKQLESALARAKNNELNQIEINLANKLHQNRAIFSKEQTLFKNLKLTLMQILIQTKKYQALQAQVRSQERLVSTLENILEEKGRITMGIGKEISSEALEHISFEPLDPEDLSVIVEEAETIKQIMGPQGKGLPFSPANLIQSVKEAFPWIDTPPDLTQTTLDLLERHDKTLSFELQKAVMDLVLISVDNIGKLSSNNGMNALINLNYIDNIITNLEHINDAITMLEVDDKQAMENFIEMLNTVKNRTTEDNSTFIKFVLSGQHPKDFMPGENYPVNQFLHESEEKMHQLLQSVTPETITAETQLPQGSVLPKPIAELLDERMRNEEW